MTDLNTYFKRITPDARSTRGIISRGNNIYRGGSNSAKPLDLRKAARRKMGPRDTMTAKQFRRAAKKAAKRRKL